MVLRRHGPAVLNHAQYFERTAGDGVIVDQFDCVHQHAPGARLIVLAICFVSAVHSDLLQLPHCPHCFRCLQSDCHCCLLSHCCCCLLSLLLLLPALSIQLLPALSMSVRQLAMEQHILVASLSIMMLLIHSASPGLIAIDFLAVLLEFIHSVCAIFEFDMAPLLRKERI